VPGLPTSRRSLDSSFSGHLFIVLGQHWHGIIPQLSFAANWPLKSFSLEIQGIRSTGNVDRRQCLISTVVLLCILSFSTSVCTGHKNMHKAELASICIFMKG
jgi:hypothetical protein